MDPEKLLTYSEPLFDDYEITNRILATKSGNFGTTSIGKKANTIIAIKELNYDNKSSKDNFIKTKCQKLIQLQTKLNLEHLIRYIDYRFENDKRKHYLMLEFCAQRDLGRYVKKQEVTLEKKLSLMVQCGKGLAALHSCRPQILHRYIKPENILIKTENGQDIVKITDYYMAAIHASGSTESAMSESRRLSGTEILPHEFYKPPEHFRSYDDTIDVITSTEGYDVFSLGMVYLALLNCQKDGLHPYLAENSDAIGHLMHVNKGQVNLFGENVDASEELLQIQKVLTDMLIYEPSRPKATDVVEWLERITEEKTDGCNSEETKQEDIAIRIFRKFSDLVTSNGSLNPKGEKVVDFFLHNLSLEEQKIILKYGSISDYLMHCKDSVADLEASKLQVFIEENGQITCLGTQSKCLDDLQENNLSETESSNSSGSVQYESDEEYKTFTHQLNSDEKISQLVQYTYKNYHADNKIYMIVNENMEGEVRDHVQKHYHNHENITIVSAVEEEDVWLMETVPNKKDQSSTQGTENGLDVGKNNFVTTDIMCNKMRISKLIGPGNFIMKDEKFNFLQTYLKNKQIYNIEEDLNMFADTMGWCTLGCVLKNINDNKLYILSVKHLMNKNIGYHKDKEACIVSGFKHPYEIFPGSSKRSFRNSITANDLVGTAKGYAGVYDAIQVEHQPKWVDVAVYEITDTLRSLHKKFNEFPDDSRLKVVTTNDKTLKGRKVWKYGAKTGETHGKIIATGLNDKQQVSNSKSIHGGGTFVVATVNDSGVPDEVCTFADGGDSGSLVILDDKSDMLNAVGIIYKIKKTFLYVAPNNKHYYIENATRCVRLDACMEALQRYMGVNWCPELYYYYFVPQCLFTHSKPEDSHREEHKEKFERFDFYS